jgi:hypothetical protein
VLANIPAIMTVLNAWAAQNDRPHLARPHAVLLQCRSLYGLSRNAVAPMQYATLETAALSHVDDSYYFGAYCGKCKHTARLSLVKLREHLGDCFPLVDVRLRLRCQRCRSKHIIVTFLTPDHCTGDLARLFELPLS